MHSVVLTPPHGQTDLKAKVAFLSGASAYSHPVKEVTCRETHMSWVFLAGDRVYKLKKPVRFPYLDFSTLPRREAACRAELRLNRRLAPDVYLDVTPLRISADGFAIGGDQGRIADWLVVMRRLDEQETLEHAITSGQIEQCQVDRLADALVRFYRQAIPAPATAERHLVHWRRDISDNRRILLDARLRMPPGLVRRIDHVLRCFLARRSHVLAARIRGRHLVDGHGDLRPEHIWLGDPVRIIDCLEFNDRLRMLDPFDEIAYLDLECERLGAAWVGRYVRRKVARGLPTCVPKDLYRFYRCHRAMLRARLAIAHLLEPSSRTPEKWPVLAQHYLQIAEADAVRLLRLLRRREDRRAGGSRAGAVLRPRTAVPTARS